MRSIAPYSSHILSSSSQKFQLKIPNMQLSQHSLSNISANGIQLPEANIFSLPEKVLQFGTGVLLRGLPDYFIDKANQQGIFNGRVVVVKSTDSGGSEAFDQQNGLYTICVRGLEDGQKVEENYVNSSVSRVLSAKNQWADILACAHNPEMRIVISNTTEVGIQLVPDDKVDAAPPQSFPGKLLAFLYERYKTFGTGPQSGMVIVPTELITNNGDKLKEIVLELAYRNNLDDAFTQWLTTQNYFCNSLVDRIVPGKPSKDIQQKLQSENGYTDELIIMAEAYRLWAIEGDDNVKEILSFAPADEGVVITPDIELFRELKIRMLNGTHTLSCAVAYLSGCTTVKNAMDDVTVSAFIENVMLEDIARAIPIDVSADMTKDFGLKVLDRFRNPHIEHLWHSISMNYTSKLKMRVVPVLQTYYQRYNEVPPYIATGFAAYLLFMKGVRQEGGKVYGAFNGVEYVINDESAGYLYDQWQNNQPAQLVTNVLQNEALWGTNLATYSGFAEAVSQKLEAMQQNGVKAVIND
jgi:tagaturonate reductase